MSVLFETSLGDIVIDLEVDQAPELCSNFLKVHPPLSSYFSCRSETDRIARFFSLAERLLCSLDPLVPASPALQGLLLQPERVLQRCAGLCFIAPTRAYPEVLT